MLQTVSRHKDICSLERRPVKPSRTANEIISGMSPRSLDYSQGFDDFAMMRSKMR
ncbi:hypothetical protein Mpsy_1778 [Methanolobus psychrophilus R15]|nr:hypothetical protein Mpsy_1778 [Methanolobus psychrophilus R15]